MKHNLMVTVRTHAAPGRLGLRKSYTARCSCGWTSDECVRRGIAKAWAKRVHPEATHNEDVT